MFSKEIMACLEQKVILMTQILNITKQIEVQCKQPEVNLENLLDTRGDLMERTKKCDHFIRVLAQQLDDDQKERIQQILNGSAVDCSEEEQRAMDLVQQCSSLFDRAAILDRAANEAIKQKYEETKRILIDLKKSGKEHDLFYR